MISRELFERYRRDLDMVLEAGRRGIANMYARAEAVASSEEELRWLISIGYSETMRSLFGPVDVVASDFYTDERAQAGVTSQMGDVSLRPIDSYGPLLQTIVDDACETHGTSLGRVNKLQGAGDRVLMGRAESTLEAHIRADPDKPLWAIIPQPGACAFCLMVASRGFTYHSKGRANTQRHDHCKCKPVVEHDTKNPALEGYDLSRLEDLYKEARKRAPTRQWRDITKAVSEVLAEGGWEDLTK